jgi:hypothetical protein
MRDPMRLGFWRVLDFGLTLHSHGQARAAAAPCERAMILPVTVARTAADSAVLDCDCMFSPCISPSALSVYRPLAAESTNWLAPQPEQAAFYT